MVYIFRRCPEPFLCPNRHNSVLSIVSAILWYGVPLPLEAAYCSCLDCSHITRVAKLAYIYIVLHPFSCVVDTCNAGKMRRSGITAVSLRSLGASFGSDGASVCGGAWLTCDAFLCVWVFPHTSSYWNTSHDFVPNRNIDNTESIEIRMCIIHAQ